VNKLLIVILVSALLALLVQAQEPSATTAPSPTATVAPASIDPEKERLIRELLVRTKETEMAVQRIMQGVAGMQQAMPRVPEKYWAEYREKINADELRNRLVRVYDKYFTVDELKALLQFYDSATGKKLTEAKLPILRESMEIAQEQARRAAEIVGKDFRTEQFLQRPRAAGSLALPPIAPSPQPTSTPQ
jgi:hypothetical protein